MPAPAATAPCSSIPALCQTCSWETLNSSFQAFAFLAAVFLFSLPRSLPFTLWLLGRLSSSVYPPQLCRAFTAADPLLANAREMKRQSLWAPAVCMVSWALWKCLIPSVETEYFLL